MAPFEEEVPEPPPDPEDWTYEEWIDWLEATEADVTAQGEFPPSTVAGRVARSAGGQVLGQAMFGMAAAIYGERETTVAIVQASDGEPEKKKPFSVHLDPEHPERSSVVFRADPESPD